MARAVPTKCADIPDDYRVTEGELKGLWLTRIDVTKPIALKFFRQ